ncbi:MAG: hypothetical protein ABW189_02150 [Rickettsiales bacterium]
MESKKLTLAALAGMTAISLAGCKSIHDKKETNACKTETKKEANTCSANDAHSCAARDNNSCK